MGGLAREMEWHVISTGLRCLLATQLEVILMSISWAIVDKMTF